ncbi:MAG: ATP-binding cassette domain-containing protein [Treponema sp.]|jgi:ABC-2 type transport system ATP-binding protein|nr:ATP-binding cassette domain-containing protein [Treponema sp.]
MPVIEMRGVSKIFEYYKKEAGLKNSLKNLFHREKLFKKAVDNFSFTADTGEILGFLGPNGAGKTTTLKLLSGILYPTEGEAAVMGHVPWKREKEFKRNIAVVMAQKTQLWWDLPANESILLNRYIYDLPEADYRKNLDRLTDLFKVRDLLQVQVRRLSLGERMKFEIIASLIHNPKVIFLDEPTIGLDVAAQRDMRDFIREYNREYGATIILTSHYMQDIENLCSRVVIINEGAKVYDGLLRDMKKSAVRIINFRFPNAAAAGGIQEIEKLGLLTAGQDGAYRLEVGEENVKKVFVHLVEQYDICDFSIQDQPIENRIMDIYREGKRQNDEVR